MGDLLMLSFRGRPFRHAEAVPGTALTIAILIAISRNVKCLMSYIRVERRGMENRGGKGEPTFSREIGRLARALSHKAFRGIPTIVGRLGDDLRQRFDRDFGSSSDVRRTLSGLDFVMRNRGASRSRPPRAMAFPQLKNSLNDTEQMPNQTGTSNWRASVFERL
ncbi:hypothetical protein WL71_20120 [Burkholderia ubonensis]|uniref:Uncharacterized protein n=1 Tax=Burkholderia ubonensis TaxID=101571 RepID=A0A107GJ00_9BURK|nr:hypothetical protein WM29_18040 [Burkholderia ubonensis]KWD80555.1 hypothetical protein WL71_20120 [Burkholderia ubonensis]KWD86474.1 hypothetical protein WL70_10490 [Burkholderia ubonensis]KWE03553.1 hypothetical protein WL72_04080 [Burkholderia ubonensis]KWE12694.1 hypothetical protein WL73_31345 [Burkholderia ubonensis]